MSADLEDLGLPVQCNVRTVDTCDGPTHTIPTGRDGHMGGIRARVRITGFWVCSGIIASQTSKSRYVAIPWPALLLTIRVYAIPLDNIFRKLRWVWGGWIGTPLGATDPSLPTVLPPLWPPLTGAAHPPCTLAIQGTLRGPGQACF